MAPRKAKVVLLRNSCHHVDMTGGETIGQRIKRERLALEMTQRALADAVDVGVPHISKVEAGKENPSDDLLRRLAAIFGIDADELFIVARRLPETVLETLAEDPSSAVAFLRSWPSKRREP